MARLRWWISRPWWASTAQRFVDPVLAVLAVGVPAALAYDRLNGENHVRALKLAATLVAATWLVSIGLRAVLLTGTAFMVRRQKRALEMAATYLEDHLEHPASGGMRLGARARIRSLVTTAAATDEVRSVVTTGSGLLVTYLPAILLYLSLTTPTATSLKLLGSTYLLRVYIAGALVVIAFCMAITLLMVVTAQQAQTLRGQLARSVRGHQTSEYVEKLEIGCVIANRAGGDAGWHLRKTRNVGGAPLKWRTLGFASSDLAAYPHRRRIEPVVVVRAARGLPVDGQRVVLAPISRPLHAGTSPLLEYVAVFVPPIETGCSVTWRVDFDWPNFSDNFRASYGDRYGVTFSGQTSRFCLTIRANPPVFARIDVPADAIAGARTRVTRDESQCMTRCIVRYEVTADSHRAEVEYRSRPF